MMALTSQARQHIILSSSISKTALSRAESSPHWQALTEDMVAKVGVLEQGQ